MSLRSSRVAIDLKEVKVGDFRHKQLSMCVRPALEVSRAVPAAACAAVETTLCSHLPPLLCSYDNGVGLDPPSLKQMLCFGHSNKLELYQGRFAFAHSFTTLRRI